MLNTNDIILLTMDNSFFDQTLSNPQREEYIKTRLFLISTFNCCSFIDYLFVDFKKSIFLGNIFPWKHHGTFHLILCTGPNFNIARASSTVQIQTILWNLFVILMCGHTKNLCPIDLAVLTFTVYKQTNRQAKYI